MKFILLSTFFAIAASAAIYQTADAAPAADSVSYAVPAADPVSVVYGAPGAAADVPVVPEPTFGPAYASVQADVAAETNVNYNLPPYLNVRPSFTHGPFQDDFQGYPKIAAFGAYPYGPFPGPFSGPYSGFPIAPFPFQGYFDSPYPFYPEFGYHHHHHRHHFEDDF